MTTDNNAPADDVVARLRDLEGLLSGAAGKGNFVLAKDAATCRAAASEIERLRAERDELKIEIVAAKTFGGGFFADRVEGATREFYRAEAIRALTGKGA